MFLKDILNNLVVAAYKIKGGYTKIKVRGQSILISVEHWRTFKRAQTYAIKEPETLDWIDNFKPNTCYFDVGANIGQYSLYPAEKFGESVKIYAFEPQSNNYYALNKNIFLNKLRKNIVSYCVAVSGTSEFSELYVPKFIPGGNRSQFGKEDIENMKISASHTQGMFGVTLDDLCEKWGLPYPNYIKIDVDGIEIPILKGAKNVLSRLDLKSVIVELGTQQEQNEAVSLMEQAGLKLKHKTTKNWGETCFVFERA
ncbi:MAG: FkbM family methyltransferase [Nitrosomonas sp.]|nr:FkbM family methyltransferase [Nitrosomonas sp.]